MVGEVGEVRKSLETILRRHPALTFEVISESSAVFCEVRPGWEIAPVAFGTDIKSLKTFGKPLLIGPGSIHDAHTSGEKIGKAEAVEAVEYYQKLAKELLAE